jgi:hypothetical protein
MGGCARCYLAPGQMRLAGKHMKAIVIAVAMTMLLLVLITFAGRIRPTSAKQMTLIFFSCLIVSLLVWLKTPVDLGFLAQSLLVYPAWLDLSLMLFFFSAAFFGGLLQLYNLADRGFSLRILIDIEEAGISPISADWVMTNYGSGQGLAWMYRKRIEGLLEANLVRPKARMLVLTSKGRRAADVLFAVRCFLRLEPLAQP